MGKPKKGNKARDEDFEDNDETSLEQMEDQPSQIPSSNPAPSKKDKKKKKGKARGDDDDMDIEDEIKALSLQANGDEEDEDDNPQPILSKKKDKKKTKGMSAFQLLAMEDEEDDDDVNESDQDNEEEEDKSGKEIKQEHAADQNKSKKKEKNKKKEKQKKPEEEDIDAIMASLEATDKPKKKGKKNKKNAEEGAGEEEPSSMDASSEVAAVDLEAKAPKVVTIDDLEEDDEEYDKKKKKKNKKKGKGIDEAPSAQGEDEKKQGDDNEEDEEDGQEEGEEGATVKTAAQKRKEKRDREKLKKQQEKQKQKKGGKKEEEGESVLAAEDAEKSADAAVSKEGTPETAEKEEDKEDGKEGKKKKKKKGEKEDKEKPKPNKMLAKLKEQLKKIQEEDQKAEEERERLRIAEDERIKRLEEEERLEEEKRQKKKQKKKEREERLKKEGKFLTEKQKQDKRRLEQMLEAMKEAGVDMPNKEEVPRKKPVYGKKKKTQTNAANDEQQEKSPSPETPTSPVQPELVSSEQESTKEEALEESKKNVVVKKEEVKEAWDAESEEEEDDDEDDQEEESKSEQKAQVSQSSKEPQKKEEEEEDESEEEEDEDDDEEDDDDEDEEDESEEYYDSNEDEDDDENMLENDDKKNVNPNEDTGAKDANNVSEDKDSGDDDDDDEDESEEYYDDWYDEFDDSVYDAFDEDESEEEQDPDEKYDITEHDNGDITISPIPKGQFGRGNTRSPAAPVKSTVSPPFKKSQKVPSIDKMPLEADEAASHADKSHYSQGVIYDPDYPQMKTKPSVKKDLSGPAAKRKSFTNNGDNHAEDSPSNSDKKEKKKKNRKKEKKNQVQDQELPMWPESGYGEPPYGSVEELKAAHAKAKKTEDSVKEEIPSVKKAKQSEDREKQQGILGGLKNKEAKEASVTGHFGSLDQHVNTESAVSTSPNPPPPGAGGQQRPLTSTTIGYWTDIMMGDQPVLVDDSVDSEEDVDEEGFVQSHPIEFCKYDIECPAGRTCVHSVCKCFKPSMCAGHHKPVCGSDGVQYPSHCELHRTACVTRAHIRIDRRGLCFKKDLQVKEKSWLMEQEELLAEDKKKEEEKIKEEDHIPAQEIYEYPQDLKSGFKTSDVKKSYGTVQPNEPSKETTAENKEEEKKKETTKTEVGKKECTWKEMAKFKDALLMYHCEKFVEPNCNMEVKTDRQYLSMLMFSYYDHDFDFFLTAEELDDKERDEHFSRKIIINCHLRDFVKFADNSEVDGKLTVTEFTDSFELEEPAVLDQIPVSVIPTLASAGNGLELKCGVDAKQVVWKRYGTQLTDDTRGHQLMVFEDGALFFSKVGLHHIGNYTCMDAEDSAKAQVHQLRVQTAPIVHVSPVTQTHLTGSDIELHCHAEGIPEPSISWRQGEQVIENNGHSTIYYGGGHIAIHNAHYDSDAGTYTCTAHNQAGTTEKSVSVTVLPPYTTSHKVSARDEGTFVVFHPKGVSSYNPLMCITRHNVHPDFGDFKFIPDALDEPLSLCRTGKDCQWGGAVKVGADFIYATQPDQSRVVIVDAGNTWNPLQVIGTDERPQHLWYVSHLDQVWVLCGGDSGRTIVVIRDASQHIQHRSVHTRPVGNHFDLVENLFIAPPNDLDHDFDYGYVSHAGQSSLFKLSLEDMGNTKSIDLSNYGCVPRSLAFVPVGGHIVIQCVSAADQHTLQLVMDHLTDTIISTVSLAGRPMVSPDSRHLITVDEFTGKVVVASISEEGVMERTYEVTVSASISDVAFLPSTSHHGYDLVLTSADDDDIIIMNLVTGKVEKMPGSQYTDPSGVWHPSPVHRHIVSGNAMSSYFMAPSKSSLAILNAKFRQVECEFRDSTGSDVMVYIPSKRTS
ncbi:uncharacterized protein LOC101862789 [Aplysia californica]|uniref:Uncharacterized protein LOC101862789 n=1 Tax=Aplysia californica TaxID=6500 RepID=A0ABM0JIZ2_APLCA|nr:uncharacterized protein LOC101862789 [Aplysia californica]